MDFEKRPLNIQKAKCTELQIRKNNLLGNRKHYGKNADHVQTTDSWILNITFEFCLAMALNAIEKNKTKKSSGANV